MQSRYSTLAAAGALAFALGCSGGSAPQSETSAERSHPDFKNILGTWKIVASEWDGDPNQEAIGNHFTFNNARMDAWLRTIGEISVDYEIDPTRNPKHLKATMGFPPNQTLYLGIYELDGDTLKLCFRKRERPTSFKTELGSMSTSHVLERIEGAE